jgi:superkiller protein 3
MKKKGQNGSVPVLLLCSLTSMSSSFVKSKLKASRDAIQAKDWERAIHESDQALEHEANNYNAQVFRGLAQLQLKRYDESEKAYKAAIESQPSQALAWQGLEKFYTQREDWGNLSDVLQSLLDLSFIA